MGRPSGNKRRSKQRSIRNKRKNLSRDRSSKAARRARRNARLNAKRGTDRTGSLKINVSARRAAKHLANTRVARALGLTGIGNRIANRVPKNWNVKANLKTAIKSKIGEKNYRRTSANNPGSGGGLTDQQLADYDFYSKYNPQGITVSQAKKMYANQLREGISLKDAMASNPSETGYFDALIPDKKEPKPIDTEQIPPDFGPRPVRGIPRERMGPQQDWLSQLYSSHNISGGKLDQGARDYWTSEAKTKGRDAVMQSIIGTAKAQGTYGGRKKPRRITTGRTPTKWRGGFGGLGAALASGAKNFHTGHSRAKRAEQKHRQQAAARQKSYDLQVKGYKRRQGMLAKTIAATMAARGM